MLGCHFISPSYKKQTTNEKQKQYSFSFIKFSGMFCLVPLDSTHTHVFTHTQVVKLLSNSTFDLKLNCFVQVKNTVFI